MSGENRDARQEERSNEEEESSNTANTSRQQIIVETAGIFKSLICKTVENSSNPELTDAIMNALSSVFQSDYPESEEEINKFAMTWMDIADGVNRDRYSEILLNSLNIRSPEETFTKVCTTIFKDGKINWRRIVIVFYFACRLIIRVAVEHNFSLVNAIFSTAMEYFTKHLLTWVVEHGGWNTMYEYGGTDGTPTNMMIALLVAAACSLIYVLWKQR